MTMLSTKPDSMIVSMGPHHPSMHGVLRLIVTLDGENVVDCEPILGYLHRGMEKIAENRSILQYLPYVTRWDYLATMFTEAVTVNAPEKLANIQIPKRASYAPAPDLQDPARQGRPPAGHRARRQIGRASCRERV